jgi:hypothetical protein
MPDEGIGTWISPNEAWKRIIFRSQRCNLDVLTFYLSGFD